MQLEGGCGRHEDAVTDCSEDATTNKNIWQMLWAELWQYSKKTQAEASKICESHWYW